MAKWLFSMSSSPQRLYDILNNIGSLDENKKHELGDSFAAATSIVSSCVPVSCLYSWTYPAPLCLLPLLVLLRRASPC